MARLSTVETISRGCIVLVRVNMSVFFLPLMNLVLGCLYDLWHHLKAAFIWYMQVSRVFPSKKLVQSQLVLYCFTKVQYFSKIM